MPNKPFHHGNLRAALLDEAEVVLRREGVDALSLRGLARSVGVSHSAPRRHFNDREALVAALAERSLRRLTTNMNTALDAAPADPVGQFVAAGRAFVTEVSENAAMSELMFSAQPRDPGSELADADAAFATTVQRALGAADRDPSSVQARRDRMLIAAVLQGIATFIGGRRISEATGRELIEDAARKFLAPIDADRSVARLA